VKIAAGDEAAHWVVRAVGLILLVLNLCEDLLLMSSVNLVSIVYA